MTLHMLNIVGIPLLCERFERFGIAMLIYCGSINGVKHVVIH